MKLFRWALVNLPVVVCLCFMSAISAGAVDLQVYKGELRILIPDHQANTLLLQYRTKTREVLRMGISNLVMTNAATKEVVRLDDRSANLSSNLDGGYWYTEIAYNDLKLGYDDYQIEGSLVLHLAGSQQTRNFSVNLKPESSMKPHGSSIDWGLNN